ncbi:endonuclease/exonuclease/phosphatase family protein [Saccharomonospora piscinae]|uniref:endonuclease/exonuclease/phosphatase family protein n=1 Tax=Saccharomonospora piscinae TaxID=687388 RepID=UPI0018CBF8F7|nr:endonuclease/exonuclease/phosphatase family protein [Saccharomonospora piscinae]
MVAVESAPGGGPRRARRGWWFAGSVVVWGVLGVFAALRLVVSEVFGHDGGRVTAAALALTPYVALAAALWALALLVRRRWWRSGVSVVLALLLAAPLVPRVVPDTQPAVTGPEVRVAALNLYFGKANPQAVVDLVRTHRVDVLSLLELDGSARTALGEAGLRSLLPYEIAYPAGAGVGSAILSRYPMEELEATGPSTFSQPSARVMLPDSTPVDVVAVHPVPPVTDADGWRSDLAALPSPGSGDVVRVLAGDFNATLDHAALRALLETGYVDAAEQRGAALTPTWPRRRIGPPVPIDHVLVADEAAVLHFDAPVVEGSDHRAVVAHLRLPE